MLRQAVFTSAALILAACAPKGQSPYRDPCRAMREEVKEMQDLDARIRTLNKQAAKYRKQGDTTSAASAEHRLKGLRENQRLLKESLEQSSRDCHPQWQDPVPVRDPARRETVENPR